MSDLYIYILGMYRKWQELSRGNAKDRSMLTSFLHESASSLIYLGKSSQMKRKLENPNSTAMEPFPQKANFDTQREDIITLTSKKLLDDMTKLQVIVVRQEQQTKSLKMENSKLEEGKASLKARLRIDYQNA